MECLGIFLFLSMNLDKYPVVVNDSSFVYEFVSEGKNGKVAKIVIYTKIHPQNFYNLGFGDKNEVTGKLMIKLQPIMGIVTRFWQPSHRHYIYLRTGFQMLKWVRQVVPRPEPGCIG